MLSDQPKSHMSSDLCLRTNDELGDVESEVDDEAAADLLLVGAVVLVATPGAVLGAPM